MGGWRPAIWALLWRIGVGLLVVAATVALLELALLYGNLIARAMGRM